jgi:hypothetical protein
MTLIILVEFDPNLYDFHHNSSMILSTEPVFEQSLNALLPFVPTLKSGGDGATVQRALNE